MRMGEPRVGGGQERRAVSSELRAAGDVVGVGVGVCGERDRQADTGGVVALFGGQAGGIDDQRGAVTQVDEVGGVTETFVDECGDGHGGFSPNGVEQPRHPLS